MFSVCAVPAPQFKLCSTLRLALRCLGKESLTLPGEMHAQCETCVLRVYPGMQGGYAMHHKQVLFETPWSHHALGLSIHLWSLHNPTKSFTRYISHKSTFTSNPISHEVETSSQSYVLNSFGNASGVLKTMFCL